VDWDISVVVHTLIKSAGVCTCTYTR